MTPQTASNLLKFIGWGFIIFGVFFVTLSFAGYDALAQKLLVLFDWQTNSFSEPMTRNARWWAGILSGLSAGFGGLYVFVVAPLLTAGHDPSARIARRGGLIAACLWMIIDSTGSYASGVTSNVVMNAVFFVMITGPLWLMKSPESY